MTCGTSINHLMDTESGFAPWDLSKAHILVSTPVVVVVVVVVAAAAAAAAAVAFLFHPQPPWKIKLHQFQQTIPFLA